MTLREERSDITHLHPVDVSQLSFTNLRVPCRQGFAFNGKCELDCCRGYSDMISNTNHLGEHNSCLTCHIFERQDLYGNETIWSEEKDYRSRNSLHQSHRMLVSSVFVIPTKDSLARAASLQECDRKRDPEGILDFLETTMNIEDYLEDITFTPNNAHADDIDFDDFELKNYNILLKDDKTRLHSEHRPFGHNGIQEELNSGKDSKSDQSEVKVKTEALWEGSPSTSASSYVSKKEMRISQQPEVYTPTTTARKYRLKTPQERNNTSYKVKRQRNNDAVRKSRSKAKQLQLMKEKQLQDALLEVSQLKEKLRVVNEKLLHCRCRR